MNIDVQGELLRCLIGLVGKKILVIVTMLTEAMMNTHILVHMEPVVLSIEMIVAIVIFPSVLIPRGESSVIRRVLFI